MQVSNLEELVAVSHEMAVAKGWWTEGEPRNLLGIFANFHGETSEAFEEYRKGTMATYYSDGGKPEGFAVELADLLVRVADLAGAVRRHGPDCVTLDTSDNALVLIARCHGLIQRASWPSTDYVPRETDVKNLLNILLRAITGWANHAGVDLWAIINQKIAYNANRPFRHGNKLA